MVWRRRGVLAGGVAVAGFEVRGGFGAEFAFLGFEGLYLRHEALAEPAWEARPWL